MVRSRQAQRLGKASPNKGTRRAPPRISRDKDTAQILCPFCWPPHPITPETPASCGTVLELVAAQTTYRAVECALCHGIQGQLVKVGDRYKHAFDCTPGKTIYTVPPDKSRAAAAIWHAPAFIHRFIAKRWGKAAVELTSEGKRTGFGWDIVRKYSIG